MNNPIQYLPLTRVLKTIIDNRGKTVPTSLEGFPLIATNCITNDSIYPIFDKVRYVDKKTFDTWFRGHLQPNDILFVNKGTPGRVCLVPNPVTFCVAQDMIGLRCNEEIIDYRYLLAVLRSREIQKKIQNFHVGLVIPHFKKHDLDNLLIPIRCKKEQEMIGSIYVGLSKKIELNNRINANLEAMINTIYDYWFVQYDFPNDNEKPYISSGGKMIWNQILKKIIPENWVNGDISSIGEIIGGSTPSTEKPEYFCNEGYAWITPKDLSLNIGNKFITKGEVDVSEKGFKSASLTIMPKGTVLFSSRAPIGYMAISRGPVTTNQGFKSIVPKPGYSTPFVFYKLKNLIPMITSYASGSTFKEASGTIMKMIETDLPPIPLIEKFTGIADPILEKQNKIELENQELKNLRDWLLPMLLNGQVGVSD